MYSSITNVLIYLESLLIVIGLEVYSKRLNKVSITSNSQLTENFYEEKEQLNKMTLTKKRYGLIQTSLMATGAILLVFSLLVASTIVAFIGLSFTFWGILFLFTRSTDYIAHKVLDATNISPYATLDRIISDLNYDGNAIYIPSLSDDNNLPAHLSILKEMIVFISSKKIVTLPSIEKLMGKDFIIKDPEGVCITPPGSGLVSLFENELQTSLTKLSPDELYYIIPKIIVTNLELASNLEVEAINETVHVKIVNSVYRNLYSSKQNLKSITLIGCPLVSSLGCSIANTTRELVTLTQIQVSPNQKTVEVWFKLAKRSS